MSTESNPIKIPQSRSEWASLDWKNAQQKIALILNLAGFMKFEEKTLGKSNRADVMIMRSTNSQVIFGIIEVKSYKKITTKVVKNAFLQSCRYITAIYNISKGNKRFGNKKKRYFAAVVFTKDYPVIYKPKNEKFREYLPKDLELIELISCVPENLMKILQAKGYTALKQNSLEEFY